MRGRLFIVVCLLVLGWLLPVSASPGKEKKPKIEGVSIDGNRAFSRDRLLGLMLTRPSGFLHTSRFHPAVFQTDLENLTAFYRQNGYLEIGIVDTTVRMDSVNNRVDISIRIEEGQLTRVEGVTVFGNTVFPDSVLLAMVKLQKDDPFRRSAVQNGMMAILNMYAERGYLDAAVTPDIKIDSTTHRALIDLSVSERGQSEIGEVRIEGLQKTRPGVVQRELSFKPGEVIRYSGLMTSQRRLYQTGLFESVFIRPVPAEGGDPDEKDILIELKERLSSEFNVAVGYGSVEKARGKIELLTRNLAGTARQLSGSITASFIRRAVEASFSEPRTLGTRWRTDLNLMFEFLEEPGYDLSRVGGRLTVGRSVRKNATAQVTFRLEHATLRHVEVEEPIEDFDSDIRSVTFSLVNDTRDDLFNPTTGMYVEFANEVAGAFLQGNNTFARSTFRWKYFHRMNRRTVFGCAFEIGWMDVYGGSDDIPLNERFYAGGPNSIRGFGYQLCGPLDIDGDPRGGKFMIVWNVAELRRTIYKMVGGVVFVDVGNVWPAITDFRPLGIRPAAGAGIRVNTPLGIVRLDYGVKLDRRRDESRAEWYFSMGHAF